MASFIVILVLDFFLAMFLNELFNDHVDERGKKVDVDFVNLVQQALSQDCGLLVLQCLGARQEGASWKSAITATLKLDSRRQV